MSGFNGNVVNVDDGYVGTLNVGAVVFAPSSSNPIPGGSSGLYINDDGMLAISDTNAATSVIIVENTFSLTLDSYVDDQTFQENKTAQEEINHHILVALDGYTTAASSGVSEDTFQENKNAQNQINQSILQALDGYGGGSGVSEITFQENKNAQEQINDTILASLDGYASAQGTATQLAYFSGTNTLTSDTNLSFDTTNNRLVAYSIQVTGDPGDGYILTSDANGVGSWQRAPIAFPSNRVFTVDATHPQADFTTIQDAITHASDGYMIIVSPGSYNEQLTLRAGISLEIIGSSNNAAAYVDVNWSFSTDGYIITAPDAGAGTTVFKNMKFSLTYDGFNNSTAILRMPSSNYGITCEDCTFSAITQGPTGGRMMGALVYGGQLELINCELSADDNDGIFDVDTIRIGGGNVFLKNTTTYGFNNADIRIDGGQASLTIENSTVVGTIVVGNVQNIFLDRVSRIGAITGNVSDTDTETKLTSRVYGVGLTNGTNEFYKLHLRELGTEDVGSPGDGEIWYSRAAGRFRMKENSVIKDMIPYSTLDGYSSANKREKSITIESPTAAEDVSWFFVNRAVTVTEIRAVLVQSAVSPSVTWTVRHGTDRNASGAEIVTGGTTTTSITTGSDVTSFNDATIVADSFIWVETTASANTAQLHLTLFYTED